jgi:membrane fusion protein (multidrug efflux system)
MVASEVTGTTSGGPANAQTPNAQQNRWRGWIIPAVVLVLAALLLLVIKGDWAAWNGGASKQTTDDAYLHSDVTPLSTKVSGVVAKVNVTDYQHVKAGDLLAELRDDDFAAQVAQAQAGVEAAHAAVENNLRQQRLQQSKIETALATVDQAKAEISSAQACIDGAQAYLDRLIPQRRRQEALFASGSTTKQKVEEAVSDAERAQAQLAASRAGVQQAEAALAGSESSVETQRRDLLVLKSQEAQLQADVAAKNAALNIARTNLAYTRIYAPSDGVVGERKVRPGQMVNPGTQVIALVEDDLWVEANYRETQLRHVSVGNVADVKIDAFPGLVLHGRVSSLSPASGSQFSLLPPDNATGNFTKITQRIPVKITLDPSSVAAGTLRPGMSVVATIQTGTTQ